MKKKVFAILYAAVTAVLLAAGISTAVRNNRKWPVSADDYEAIMEGGLSLRDEVKEAAGAVNRILQPTVYYADGDAIVRTDNDYLLTFHAVSGFDMDLAIDRITALKEFCDGYGIPLFYVSFPSKATYTELNPADYGIYSNEKETRELFLERIRETGIPLLDMAGVFKERGFSQEDVFYRTDHHWKTRMGLIAAKETAEFMKKGITQDIHTELLEEERFHTTAYEYQWLGETGRKVSAAWAGTLDDYVLYEPDYETSFEYYVPASRISTEGDFSAFIDHNLLSREPDLYQDSLHYVYMKDSKNITHFRNRNLSGANILLIKDSFSVSMAPFLAAATGDLTWWDMRKNQYDVFPYIERHRFDAVVIAYTDFWRDEMYAFQ